MEEEHGDGDDASKGSAGAGAALTGGRGTGGQEGGEQGHKAGMWTALVNCLTHKADIQDRHKTDI